MAKSRERLLALLRDGTLSISRRTVHAPGRAIVRCENVTFAYETGEGVLRGVDLELRQGEVLALVGPNGSGKTTLARHLNGLLRPMEGSIHVNGRDAASLPVSELASTVALLTQNPGDYLFERTVGSELRLTARYRGLDEEMAISEVDDAIRELALGDFLERFSWDLSAGQRQRVALGALLVGAPGVVILDEPTRGMDGGHKASLAEMARGMALEGKAVMVITHDMEFAARVADIYAVLEGGRIVAIGPPEEVFETRPGYAPILWNVTAPLDLPLGERPLSPRDIVATAGRAGGGAQW